MERISHKVIKKYFMLDFVSLLSHLIDFYLWELLNWFISDLIDPFYGSIYAHLIKRWLSKLQIYAFCKIFNECKGPTSCAAAKRIFIQLKNLSFFYLPSIGVSHASMHVENAINISNIQQLISTANKIS